MSHTTVQCIVVVRHTDAHGKQHFRQLATLPRVWQHGNNLCHAVKLVAERVEDTVKTFTVAPPSEVHRRD